MKTNGINLGILLLSAASVLVSCKKEELRPMGTPVPTDVREYPAKEVAMWKVSKLYVWGKYESDETLKFRDWGFRFNRDGVVVATKKNEEVRGTWAMKSDGVETRMYLDFGGREPFPELNNAWKVSKETSDYRLFEDDNGDDGMKGELLFERIK